MDDPKDDPKHEAYRGKCSAAADDCGVQPVFDLGDSSSAAGIFFSALKQK